MLRPDYESLVDVLAVDLARPRDVESALEQVLAPEWVITPSMGTRRWLTREVAVRLGAQPGSTDGIVANWHHEFPGGIGQRVLSRHLRTTYGLESDPWALPQLALHLYDWALRHPTHHATTPLHDGRLSIQFARARHYADLFDRYHIWRPEMILQWCQQPDDDVSPDEARQRDLFLALRHELAIPSPPERWDDAWSSLEEYPGLLPASDRMSIFGLTTYPGGVRFLDALRHVDKLVDVTLYATPGFATSPVATHRSDYSTSLLQLWGGTALANAPLVAQLRAARELDEVLTPVAPPTTLLTSLQDTLRSDHVTTVSAPDASVIEHRCHGAMRQAEVLRDAIRHDLAEHPNWRESDLLVICPDLATYAPLIRTAFGPSRVGESRDDQPAIAYRIIDTGLVDESHYIAAIRNLLALLRSRCTRTDVLQLLNQPSVRRRRRFDDESLDAIARWSRSAAIRWGLSEEHRTRFGLAKVGELNTWRAGMSRLQLGAMVENPDFRDVDGILPVEIPTGSFGVLANVAQLLRQLDAAVESSWSPHDLTYWADWFDRLLDDVIEPGPDEINDVRRLHHSLAPLRAAAGTTSTKLSFVDFSSLIEESLNAGAYLGPLFTGGVTITSPDTMRWIPFTATYVVGFDDDAFTHPGWDHDDLRRREPRAGDISPSDDARARLGEIILATRERLTILRTSRDLGTNVVVEPGVVCSELFDGVRDATVDHAGHSWFFDDVVQHPRHGFHPSNFSHDDTAFEGLRARGAFTGPWSFSRLDHQLDWLSTNDRSSTRLAIADITTTTPETVTLADLESFFKNPPRTFVRRTLGIDLDVWREPPGDDLETTLNPLTRSTTMRRLFRSMTQRGGDFDQSLQALALSGDVPPLALLAVDDVRLLAEGLVNQYRSATEGRTPIIHRITSPVGAITVTGDLHPFSDGQSLTLIEVLTSTIRLDRMIGPWLRAVALRLQSPPEIDVSLTMIFPPDTTTSPDTVISTTMHLTPTQDIARASLTTALDYFVRNLSRPIAYEPRWQPSNWAAAELTDELWHQDGYLNTDSDKFVANPYWNLLFGDLTAAEFLLVNDDPELGFRHVFNTMRGLFTTVVNVTEPVHRYGTSKKK